MSLDDIPLPPGAAREGGPTTNWSALFHAYGTATDTAEVLAGPLEAAGDHLWSAILHQGSVWPATPPVLSSVAGRLAEAPLLGLRFVRDVASSVRFGDGAEELRAEVAAAPTREWTAAYVAADEDEQVDLWSDDDGTGDLVLAAAALDCWDLLPELVDPVAAFLDDPDERVRTCAWATVTRLLDHPAAAAAHGPHLLPRLTRAAGAAGSVEERAALVMDLGDLGGDPAAFLADPSPLVRCAAATTRPLADDPAAHAELLAAARTPTAFDALSDLPRFGGGPARWTLVAVLCDRVRDLSRLHEPALAALPHAFRLAPCPDLGPYLKAHFPTGLPEHPTPEQASLARELAARDDLWSPVNGNRRITLAQLGLPVDRETWWAVG
ncbi:hypothetical protein ACIGO8_03920 [Streptomyces sp. NPDC053493]|uniref:hypothetical protein n=1 Tax=Streptomyces sp. NPDC053493 TaxID=3365705 RepID=UPI0037D44DD1